MDFISSPSARAANVGGPGLSFTRAFDVKGQPLAFPDVVRIDACGFQRADVQKHVRAAGIVSDEAIAALGVPHFQFSGSHPALFPPCLQPQLDQAADGFGAGDALRRSPRIDVRSDILRQSDCGNRIDAARTFRPATRLFVYWN